MVKWTATLPIPDCVLNVSLMLKVPFRWQICASSKGLRRNIHLHDVLRVYHKGDCSNVVFPTCPLEWFSFAACRGINLLLPRGKDA